MEELPFKVWEDYELQTKNKHKVLRDYFDKWVKILGKNSGLNYIDCFGGLGAYRDKKGEIFYGSPVIATEIIKQNQMSLGREVSLIVIDKETENINNLKKIFSFLKLEPKIQYINEDFDKSINKVLDETPNIAPTFFFVDPFGFSIKRSTLERIMSKPKSEIMFNFMFNGINRFLKLPQFEKIFDELFGVQDWKTLCTLSGKERESCILKKITGEFEKFCKFVYPYRMSFEDKNRTYYYLIHLSNHYKGCSIMKSCFAKCNHGEVEFFGKEKQLTLNETESAKLEDCKQFVVKKYKKGEIKSFSKICEENICRSFNPFLESHIRKSLNELEKEKKVLIKRNPSTTPTGKKRISLENGDEITF